MANIASVLKSEISRIARKEGRSEIDGLRKTISSQRSDIAGLRKRLGELERSVKALSKAADKVQRSGGHASAPSHRAHVAAETTADEDAHLSSLRFRAAGMAANRKRLGLSAGDFGLLVGSTGQAVYNWEAGKSKPTHHHLEAIASLRGIGKREVAQRLSLLKTA